MTYTEFFVTHLGLFGRKGFIDSAFCFCESFDLLFFHFQPENGLLGMIKRESIKHFPTYITLLLVLFQNVTNEWAKAVLSDAENLTEERVDEVLNQFLKDFEEGLLEAKNWSAFYAAYTVSKAALNAIHKDSGHQVSGFLHKLCLSWLCQNRFQPQHWHLNCWRRCWMPGEISSVAWWGPFWPFLFSEGSDWILNENASLRDMK